MSALKCTGTPGRVCENTYESVLGRMEKACDPCIKTRLDQLRVSYESALGRLESERARAPALRCRICLEEFDAPHRLTLHERSCKEE